MEYPCKGESNLQTNTNIKVQHSLSNQCQGEEEEVGQDNGKGIYAPENPMLLKYKSTTQARGQPY
jgi:hypothetical protein